ncbi:MAG TPA: sugar kinase [bacterium]|nr:sugar kinase [bacterium]HQL63372.1 sugar kinase [bacterium]
MADVVTFGEAMVRLSPPDFNRLEQTATLDVRVGGAEFNVAIGVARLGMSSAFVTRVPTNPLGRMIVNKTREHGVDCSHVVWTKEDRAGLYFLEFGASPRPSNVIYDRKDSAISRIKKGEVNWDAALSGAKLFHTSGITAALSPTAREAFLESLEKAKQNKVKVSIDLNYRAKLWTEAEAQECMTMAMKYTDILITTEEDTMRVFKIEGKDYEEVARKLHDRFGFELVLITLREDLSVWRNKWTAIALHDGKVYKTRTYEVEIVDRVGGGDSCSAGFLYGYLQDGDVQKGIDWGVAFSALKHSVPGDVNWCTPDEVKRLVGGGGLRIVR